MSPRMIFYQVANGRWRWQLRDKSGGICARSSLSWASIDHVRMAADALTATLVIANAKPAEIMPWSTRRDAPALGPPTGTGGTDRG